MPAKTGPAFLLLMLVTNYYMNDHLKTIVAAQPVIYPDIFRKNGKVSGFVVSN